MRGAEAICRVLHDEGVKYVFGVPGNTEVPLLDALSREPEIKYVSAIHEAVSMGMADGYARASGKPGVVLVHTTPGTAYVLGNLYNAYNAGSPVVVLCGQQDARMQWLDPFLDSNLLPMVSEYTKGCWRLEDCNDMAVALRRAFKEARTPPTGPVFLAIPRDLQSRALDADFWLAPRHEVAVGMRGDREALLKAAQLLVAAEQPVIVAGRQVPDAGATRTLVELAELLGAPVFVTAQVPKVIFPTDHPLYYSRVPPLGFALLGLEGTADVVLAVGSNLFKQLFHVEWPLIPSGTKMIQMDVDPRGLARDCPADVALVADPKSALADLTAEIRNLATADQNERNRLRFERLKNLREEARKAREAEWQKDWDGLPIRPPRAIHEIASVLPTDSVIVDESIMLTTYVECIMEFPQQGSYFSNNACLGWGLPASLGVSLAVPDRPVVALVGDGSALFGLQAFWTARKYEIPAVMIVLNNRGYAAIKWGFSAYPDKLSVAGADLGYDLGDVDFPALAKAFGIIARRIENPSEIGPAVQKAIGEGKPALLDLMVDPKDVGWGLPRLP